MDTLDTQHVEQCCEQPGLLILNANVVAHSSCDHRQLRRPSLPGLADRYDISCLIALVQGCSRHSSIR